MDMQTYGKMIAAIRQYLQHAHSFDLKIRNECPERYFISRKGLLTLLAEFGLSSDNLEQFIEKMYEDGHLSRDDGKAVWFKWKFFFTVIHLLHQDMGYDNSYKRNRG